MLDDGKGPHCGTVVELEPGPPHLPATDLPGHGDLEDLGGVVRHPMQLGRGQPADVVVDTEVVGEPVVNRALARLLQQYAFKPAPYPNPRDFLRLLREEAGPAHDALITDLFEKITLYDMKVTSASSTRRPDGRWDVALEVEARKLYADGKGKETEAPFAETVDVGAFTVEPGKKGYDAKSVIAVQRLAVKSGRQTLHLVVDRAPKVVGVDPFNKWVDRNSDDNLKDL